MSHPESNPSPSSGQVTPTRSSDGHSQPQVTHRDWLEEAADWWSQTLSEAGAGLRARLDEEAKHETPDPEPEAILASPRDFDRHFWQLVIPKLVPAIELGAVMVNAELETFMEASARIYQMAHKRGAGRLSHDAQNRLADWINSSLLNALSAPTPDGIITPERLAQITGEPRGC